MARHNGATHKQPKVRRPQVSKGVGTTKGAHGAQSVKQSGKR